MGRYTDDGDICVATTAPGQCQQGPHTRLTHRPLKEAKNGNDGYSHTIEIPDSGDDDVKCERFGPGSFRMTFSRSRWRKQQLIKRGAGFEPARLRAQVRRAIAPFYPLLLNTSVSRFRRRKTFLQWGHRSSV